MSETKLKPLRDGEVLVSAFVDIKDFINAVPIDMIVSNISDDQLISELQERYAKLKEPQVEKITDLVKDLFDPDLDDFETSDLLAELASRHDGSLSNGEYVEFESLQHQLLYEEFEELHGKYGGRLFEKFKQINNE